MVYLFSKLSNTLNAITHENHNNGVFKFSNIFTFTLNIFSINTLESILDQIYFWNTVYNSTGSSGSNFIEYLEFSGRCQLF